MDKVTELETDIQNIKNFFNSCAKVYKKALLGFVQADNNINFRRAFIMDQIDIIVNKNSYRAY